MSEITLGQRVSFVSTLCRESEYEKDQFQRPRHLRVWVSSPLSAPVTGIVAGIRTLTNGTVERYGYDELSLYCVKESFQAYIIYTDIRQNPVRVRAQDVIA